MSPSSVHALPHTLLRPAWPRWQSGISALHYAASEGHIEAIELLLHAKAEVGTTDKVRSARSTPPSMEAEGDALTSTAHARRVVAIAVWQIGPAPGGTQWPGACYQSAPGGEGRARRGGHGELWMSHPMQCEEREALLGLEDPSPTTLRTDSTHTQRAPRLAHSRWARRRATRRFIMRQPMTRRRQSSCSWRQRQRLAQRTR